MVSLRRPATVERADSDWKLGKQEEKEILLVCRQIDQKSGATREKSAEDCSGASGSDHNQPDDAS